jgi:hypothetical protein
VCWGASVPLVCSCLPCRLYDLLRGLSVDYTAFQWGRIIDIFALTFEVMHTDSRDLAMCSASSTMTMIVSAALNTALLHNRFAKGLSRHCYS